MLYYPEMDMFSALADPTRRTILEDLSRYGMLSATDIYNKFPFSHPAISQHLKVLRDVDLVVVEKQKQQRLYRVNPHTISEFDRWIKKLEVSWEARFDRLEKTLQKERKTLIKAKKKGGINGK